MKNGGMSCEKVLRRLCPCYYARPDESEALCTSSQDQMQLSTENPNNTSRIAEATCGFGEKDGDVEGLTAVDCMGGTFDLVHPQPLYALPPEKCHSTIDSTSFLRPPLYWKKTMKSFGCKGPPIVEEIQKRRKCYKAPSLSRSQNVMLKQSGTVAGVSTVSPENKNFSWLGCPSFDELYLDSGSNFGKDSCSNQMQDKRKNNEVGNAICRKSSNIRSGCNKYTDDIHRESKKFKVIPDISYGVIVFSAAYHSPKKLFLLKIDRLENLPLKGRVGNTFSAIIKLSVFPSDKYFKCTKMLKKSISPQVNEVFSFTVKENSGKVLRLSVFDSVAQNKFNTIGHALLSLNGVMSRHPKRFRMKLYRHTQPHITPGNLALSLNYRPKDKKFTVLVDKAKNLLLQKDKNVKLNTYVKGTLYSHGTKLKSKKSLLIMNSKDPEYNSTFTFQVKENDLDDLLIVISVRLKSFVRDTTIGRVILGPFFITDQNKLTPWGRVFLKHEFVSHWFRLYL